MRKYYLIISSILLTACAATGPQYAPGKPPKGEAKVVVYKTQTYGNSVSFTANKRKCSVQAKGHVVLTYPANDVVILQHRSIGDPSPSVFSFTPSSGQTYYVRIESNDAAIIGGSLGGTLGGLVGGLAGQSFASNEGTFIFREGTEAEALTTHQSERRC